MQSLFRTDRDNRSLLLQRLVFAGVIFAHGAQKAFGWFGGFGFEATMQFFTETLHVPALLAFLVIVGESVGALSLALGAFTRVTAAALAAIMVGAVLMVHVPHGFYMNWFGSQAGEGFEFHLLALALALPLVVRGGGAWALDSWLARRLAEVRPASPASRLDGLPARN